MNKWLLMLIALTATSLVQAASQPYETFGEYKIYYTVFNSTFIKPDIARTYSIKRGKKHALVNISIIKSNSEGDSEGLAAKISGTAANLMQQQRTLEFVEIKEQNAVYYLASMRITNEEPYTFDIKILPTKSRKPISLQFKKILYTDP